MMRPRVPWRTGLHMTISAPIRSDEAATAPHANAPLTCAASRAAAMSLLVPLGRLERRLEVVAERQREVGCGRDHACQADNRGDRDQGPDDLVDAGAGGKRQIDRRLV